MNAVAAGLRSDIDHRITFARRLRVENFVPPHQSERKSIHQRIAASSRARTSSRPPGSARQSSCHNGDATDHALQHRVILVEMVRFVRRFAFHRNRPKAQRIHHRNRPRAHRKDVAQNAADAGRRALERLNERRMIVRLDLERASPTIANVDDAGIFARALHTPACCASAAASDALATTCRSNARSTSR